MANVINRIVKLYADLEHGNCWIGTNFKEVLHGIDADLAIRRFGDKANCIWQLVTHIIYWRTTVVNRLTGSRNPPPFKDFLLPDECTEANWHQALLDFEAAYHSLRSTILHFNPDNLENLSPNNEQTYYELIMGSLQHDAYHMGQMALIKKAFA